MVEGAFMALIMCLLWNLMVYCAGMYLAKLESVYVARYATFWYASHDCGMPPQTNAAPPAYKNAVFSPVTSLNQADQQQTDQDCPAGNNGGGTADCTSIQGGGFGTGSFFAKGHTETKFTWSWQRPPWWSTALSGTGKVVSDSYVMCNEGPYGVLSAWRFVGNVISQIIGSVS
jgi:hypothetical protein